MIGLNIKVIESSDPKKKALEGKIINETKNTFVLESGKVIPKKECVFDFIDIQAKIEGKNILKSPEDRIR
jgi:RNase P/RNase MRP subunit p29